MLLRGLLNDEAMHFDSRYQTCGIPSEYLWGPGTAGEALRWLDTHQPAPDPADAVDQLMLIRRHGDQLYLPQRPEIAVAMPPSYQTGRWHLLLADHPFTAFACVRASANHDPGHQGACGCATQRLAHGEWRTVRDTLARLRPDLVVSAFPPDVLIVDPWRFPSDTCWWTSRPRSKLDTFRGWNGTRRTV